MLKVREKSRGDEKKETSTEVKEGARTSCNNVAEVEYTKKKKIKDEIMRGKKSRPTPTYARRT